MSLMRWCLLGGIACVLGGCDATVELTKAPFDATTALSNGVTQATHELLQPTTEFTSSTTPGTDTPNTPARARKKLEIFAKYSYEHLRADMARGDGEYLASLATLAGVPADREEEFRVQMRNAYSTFFDDAAAPDAPVRIVDAAWDMGNWKRLTH